MAGCHRMSARRLRISTRSVRSLEYQAFTQQIAPLFRTSKFTTPVVSLPDRAHTLISINHVLPSLLQVAVGCIECETPTLLQPSHESGRRILRLPSGRTTIQSSCLRSVLTATARGTDPRLNNTYSPADHVGGQMQL